MRKQEKLAALDAGLLSAVVLLVCAGILLVFDSSMAHQGDVRGDVWFLAKKQMIFAAVGLVAMYIASRLSFRFLRRSYKLLLYFSCALLLVVLVPGVGDKINGARSWFKFGGFQVQPSEMVKLAVVLFLAATLSRARVFKKNGPKRWVEPLGIVVGLIGLIALERDLGTAALVMGICFAMFYAAGAKKRYILLTGAAAVGIAALAMVVLPHAKVRWVAFTNPWASQYKEGYQTVHSLIALGTGGLTGVGPCEGREKLFTPAASTDYIFSTLGEEGGFIASLALLGLFGLVVYRGLDIARRSKSSYGNMLAVGLTSMIGFQALINIAVVTNSIPATGVPLPFISYGGSSLVSMLIAAGLLLSVSKQINLEPEERDLYEDSFDGRRDRRSHLPSHQHRSGNNRGRSHRRSTVRR